MVQYAANDHGAAGSACWQEITMSKVRTRFAPSPTGYMHVGAARTAIFAWAFARGQDGDFILRIEDTDKNREVEGSIEHIQKSLAWLGIMWSEGPGSESKYGPYLQSERLEIYKEWAQKLIDKGLAYADPFTPEEVQKFRDQASATKKPFLFRDYRPEEVSSPDDWYGKVPLRFKTTNLKRTTWQDEVRGELSAGEEALDDFIIIKADGYPTYNFAHVIDDHLMAITHVMRGEEFIPSTPKFIALHEALEIKLPKFATMPPILGKNGGKKLSKRDGAKDILEYKKEGYLPEAMVNFLSSLGWNDGTEDEIYTPQQLIDKFELSRVQRKGAHFDEAKLNWTNWKHYELLIRSNLAKALEIMDIPSSLQADAAELALTKSRSVEEFKNQANIFLDPKPFTLTAENLKQVDKKLEVDAAIEYVNSAMQTLESTDFSPQSLEDALRADMEKLGAQPRQYLNLVRWCVSSSKVSPDLFELMATLGNKESLARLKRSAESV